MKYLRPCGGLLEVGEDCLVTLCGYRQLKQCSLEAGGVLLGRRIDASQDVVIDAATAPSTADKRMRRFFSRARSPAQLKVDAAWTR